MLVQLGCLRLAVKSATSRPFLVDVFAASAIAGGVRLSSRCDGGVGFGGKCEALYGFMCVVGNGVEVPRSFCSGMSSAPTKRELKPV